MSYMHTLGAFAIILNADRQVLLCHRTDMPAWNLPGGGVEAGETPWDAVVREVREEVGLTVRPSALVGVYAMPSRTDLVFNFLCSVVSGEPAVSEEASAVGWFSPDKLPASTLPRHVERIHDALSRDMQSHDGTTVLLKTQA